MLFDRRLLENFDWVFLFLVIILSVFGVINLYSASYGFNTVGTPVWGKQLYWLLIGLGLMVFLLMFDYRMLKGRAYILYATGIVLLLMVMVLGRTTSGAQRWIDLGFVGFQPSEIIKVFVIISLAAYLSHREYPTGLGFKDLIGPAVLVGVPFLMIMRQPDLGTALHLAFACVSIILFLKIRPLVLLVLGSIGVVIMPFASLFLEPYQLQRIFTFVNPERDPLGSGYHIIQSKIAVGSGQFWGKGFLKGTQSQLRFLPEQHTDFAFSVFAEEWGFIGSMVLLGLYLFLILTGLNIAARSQDRFGALMVLGLVALLFWQVFINICMVTGLMPVVGLPLPLISYGGTSLVTTLVVVGLILNVSMRRFLFHDSKSNDYI